MARISAALAGGQNVLAFLDMTAISEGTSTSPYTKDDGYDVVVSGTNSPHIFTNYAKHPGILVTVNDKGLQSTAAGRYQERRSNWIAYSASLRLPDFGPISQDRIAIRQITEQLAMDDIKKGLIAKAINKCANIWASFPGAGYGQPEHTADCLISHYIAAGGVMA